MARRSLPEAQPGYRWELALPASPPPRRRPGRWIAGILVIVAFGVGAWFVGEWLARDLTTKTIRTLVASQLHLPASQKVDVDVSGAVLPQLIVGTLGDVTISSQDVALGPFEGDVRVVARDIPVRGGADLGGASATITMDEGQLRALLATVDGFPSESVALAAPDVTMTFTLSFFGVDFPVGVALAPSARDGDLVLTPSSFRLGDADVSADDLRQRFGTFADPVLRDWPVCLGRHLPAGVALSSVEVRGADVVASFAVDGGIARDPELQQPGSCS